MNYPGHPSYSDDDYEGCITAGRATGRPLPFPSEEELKQLEEAWNNPRAYQLAMEESFHPAGYVPLVDPNRPLVPSEEEIKKLPRWARVAFAARCGRRILPLFRMGYPDAPAKDLEAIRTAVTMAERHAAEATLANQASGIDTRDAYDTAVRAAYFADSSRAGPGYAAAIVVAAARDLLADPLGQARTIADNADDALVLADPRSRVFIRRDFTRLVNAAKANAWTDDTPVPPDVFGPMWEGTPPSWWTDDVFAGLPPEPVATRTP